MVKGQQPLFPDGQMCNKCHVCTWHVISVQDTSWDSKIINKCLVMNVQYVQPNRRGSPGWCVAKEHLMTSCQSGGEKTGWARGNQRGVWTSGGSNWKKPRRFMSIVKHKDWALIHSGGPQGAVWPDPTGSARDPVSQEMEGFPDIWRSSWEETRWRRGKKMEEGADKREWRWKVKQTGTEDMQCWRRFNRRTNLKVPYHEKFPLPVFSNNQSPAQRSQIPRPWNRYGPPNRFNAACHSISSYNDTLLLFVQHTPEAELLA